MSAVAPAEWKVEIPLDVIQFVEKVAGLVEHRRAGGTSWRITVEANGTRAAVVERDVRGLRVVFSDPGAAASDEERNDG